MISVNDLGYVSFFTIQPLLQIGVPNIPKVGEIHDCPHLYEMVGQESHLYQF